MRYHGSLIAFWTLKSWLTSQCPPGGPQHPRRSVAENVTTLRLLIISIWSLQSFRGSYKRESTTDTHYSR